MYILCLTAKHHSTVAVRYYKGTLLYTVHSRIKAHTASLVIGEHKYIDIIILGIKSTIIMTYARRSMYTNTRCVTMKTILLEIL